MTDPNNALTTQDSNALTLGQTHLRPQDLVLPRIKLLQAQSQEVADKAGEVGEFFNVLTSENYGPALRFIPIQPFMNRIFLMRTQKRDRAEELLEPLGIVLSESDGLKCRSHDMTRGTGEPGLLCETECPLSQWHDREPPLCSETWNIAAMTEIGDLVVLSFSRSSATTGKRMFSMLRMSPALPWSKVYEVTSKQEKGVEGHYQVPVVKPVGSTVGDAALMRQAVEWAQRLGAVGTLDVTPADVEDEQPNGVAEPAGF